MGDFSVAHIRREADGTRTVLETGPVILVSTELLADPNLDPDFIEPDGTLRLDTAGQYRYRRCYARDNQAVVYERISPETE